MIAETVPQAMRDGNKRCDPSYARAESKETTMLEPQPQSRCFEASLPRLETPVHIATLHDAQVFARRWVIRDKDPALKRLLRQLERVRSSEETASALSALQHALASRNLLPAPHAG